MVQSLSKMTVKRNLVSTYCTNFMRCIVEAITIAVNLSILCRHIRKCNPSPCAGMRIRDIKWHDVLQKIDAVENGSFVMGEFDENGITVKRNSFICMGWMRTGDGGNSVLPLYGHLCS